jgi:short-subunit dehydrogenase
LGFFTLGISMNTTPPLKLDRQTAQKKYGPWAVIAGASEGSGACFARELAALGINTVLISRRPAALGGLAGDLEANYGIQTRVLALDLTLLEAGDRILAATRELDVGLYISNAGSDGGPQAFLANSIERTLNLINMNVRTVAVATEGFARRMSRRGGGGIVIMTSVAGLGGHPELSVYAATKSFEVSFVEGLWGEFGPLGIDILGVVVPSMDTPSLRRGTEGTNFDISQALDPVRVIREALDNLAKGPLLFFSDGSDGADLGQARRERVLSMMEWNKSLTNTLNGSSNDVGVNQDH